jgi:hypothetical protein
VADCKLIDTSEEYLVKWLIGMIRKPFKITIRINMNLNLNYTVQDFDVDRAERMLRQVFVKLLA